MNVPDFEQLTLFREDFPASPSVWLESKKEKKMTVTYGLKCSELSENLRRVGSLVRTYLESCELPLPTLSRTWSVKAIKPSCLIMKLRLSALSIAEKESFSLENGNPGLWKTPVAADGSNRKFYRNSRGEANLSGEVKLWPTPRCGGSQGSSPIGVKHGDLAACVGGQLNPTWVEWLMGFPTGWTELNRSEMP